MKARPLLLLPIALLLSACPKEQSDASVRIEAGRIIFDGDRSDCIMRLEVASSGDQSEVWALESPLPIGNDESCPLRFPVGYGAAPAPAKPWPDGPAPALVSGRSYTLTVTGTDKDHQAVFTAP